MVRREIDDDSSNVETPERMARSFVEDVEEVSAKRQAALARRNAEARKCTKN